ncbi:tail fiber protein [Xanthobacter sp. DSM 24535]|uniref:phage tail protein n=1 Tax=Roseixanthobacter psychrophilus TaxID=3119917 RepID=UPI00372AF805
MSEFYIGEIRLFPFARIPDGWHACDGALLPVNQNQALYSLLGTRFGGNSTNFALPDLRGRVPVGFNTETIANRLTINMGTAAGSETVTLSQSQMPVHTHAYRAATAEATATAPTNAVFATVKQVDSAQAQANLYGPTTALTALKADTLRSRGGSAPHANVQPSLVLNFCIALQGIYPGRI